jgi:hypothetical protein
MLVLLRLLTCATVGGGRGVVVGRSGDLSVGQSADLSWLWDRLTGR